MTAVPLPGVTWPVRHEVRSPFVLHPLWEPQQNPYIIIGGLGAVGGAGLGEKNIVKEAADKKKKKRLLSVSHKWDKEKRREAGKGLKAGTYLRTNLRFKAISRNNAVLTGRAIRCVALFTFLAEPTTAEELSYLSSGCCWQWSAGQITTTHLWAIAANSGRIWKSFREWSASNDRRANTWTAYFHQVNSVLIGKAIEGLRPQYALLQGNLTTSLGFHSFMLSANTFFSHAEFFPTITPQRKIRQLTEGTFLGQGDLKTLI